MRCTGLVDAGLTVNLSCSVRGRIEDRQIVIPLPAVVQNEDDFKNALLTLAFRYGRPQDTGNIVQLSFGEDHAMPANLLFNNVPHAPWVRTFLYEAATYAVLRAVEDPLILDKSRLQIKVNYPEVCSICPLLRALRQAKLLIIYCSRFQ